LQYKISPSYLGEIFQKRFMISVTILVKNGQRHLQRVLQALSDFDEVVVADSGSSDNTESIAKSFPNVCFHLIPFEGFGNAHNRAANLAKHPWILSIDSDEVLTPALAQEILHLRLDPQYLYALPFHNYFNGKWIKWCGWFPETHVRLYHKQTTSFSEALVHEKIKDDGFKIKYLKAPLFHYPYESISDFLIKMERYSSLFAKQYVGKKNSNPLTALSHGVGAFMKSYFLKKGFLGGYEGFLISAYNAHTAFYKYLKLYHLNKSSRDVN
jgi:glycosyltransferase involved in cell wall biosynthesis